VQDMFIGKWVFPQGDSLEQQVGRGKETNLDVIVKDIITKLEITKKDVVLDVCCGNGMITRKIADECESICGVDFSEVLINTAKQKNQTENITYYLSDALNITNIFPDNCFDKSYLYFSFQYFKYDIGKQVIKMLSQVTKHGGKIFIGDIPDKTRRSNYYNTFRKRLRFLKNSVLRILENIDGEDSLGWWWHPNRMKRICRKLDLKCEIIEQNRNLPHYNYRFDALILNIKRIQND